MESTQNESFQYTYSAREQAIIREIRSKYEPRELSLVEQLKRMDAKATQKAALVALIVGVIGALVLGVGMCCCMVWSGIWFVPGILIGIVGMALVGAAYPLYQWALKRERKRIAPEVLRLSGVLIRE